MDVDCERNLFAILCRLSKSSLEIYNCDFPWDACALKTWHSLYSWKMVGHCSDRFCFPCRFWSWRSWKSLRWNLQLQEVRPRQTPLDVVILVYLKIMRPVKLKRDGMVSIPFSLCVAKARNGQTFGLGFHECTMNLTSSYVINTVNIYEYI